MNTTNKAQTIDFMKNNALYFVLLVLLSVIIYKDSSFLSMRNFSNILTQSSVLIILALGVASLIVTQGTDLSVGRMVGLAAVVSASLLQSPDNVNRVYQELSSYSPWVLIPMTIAIILVIGMIFGFLNGVVVTYLNVTPFIATLGMMLVLYGINSLYFDKVGAQPIAGLNDSFLNLSQGSFKIPLPEFISHKSFKLSYLTIYATVAVVMVWIMWNKTRFGKNLFAIGGNPEAAKVSGVNVTRNLLAIYTIGGAFYAFGGFLEAGRVGSATNNLGFMYELDAIAACVIGGVSFTGGVGRVSGVVMGVVIFTIINYGLTYINVNPNWQYVIKGSIIVLAVAIDSLKYANKK